MPGETRVGHWLHDDCDVYAGRDKNDCHLLTVEIPATRGWLGNPFTVDEYGREEAIERFRKAFEYRLENDGEFRNYVAGLAGKTLGCWCQRLNEDGPACHAEVIAEHADRLANAREVSA